LNSVLLDGLCHLWRCQKHEELARRVSWTRPDDSLWVLPRSWQADPGIAPGRAIFHGDAPLVEGLELQDRQKCPWIVITNGRFAAYTSHQLLARLLDTTGADVVAVTAASDLLACQERVRLTGDNRLVGYRRLYADSMAPIPVPTDWPHHLLVRRAAFDRLQKGGLLSGFDTLVAQCRAEGLRVEGMAVAGTAFDLESEDGVLALCQEALRHRANEGTTPRAVPGRPEPVQNGGQISPDARLIGSVRLGRQVVVEAGAVLVGPVVLCDGSGVGRHALIDSSIIGAGVSVEPNQSLRDCIVGASKREHAGTQAAARAGGLPPALGSLRQDRLFRTWPRFSYARCFKRVADVVAAVAVLILFAPVIPLIALAVKLSSPGPVFFGHKRQGLHGRLFHCFKFRTMKQGADEIQDKLRFVSEVDGPQFKMADDPRITAVGRFLRETYLDEIPQFYNVLRGEMSVVGPRPSPESENTLCPSWRDARLSVRPGVTGLWQVYRTRQPHKDFQEWIHYDTQYVREFSFGLDLWICWGTFRRMIENFIRQF
jgi:lipopolysaccharide/colanic/teichoic acid biosynthesis glycosyltransferase